MFVDSSIKAPRSNGRGRPALGSLGWFLPFEQLLQIYPFSLSFRQESRTSLRTEVSYNYTFMKLVRFLFRKG